MRVVSAADELDPAEVDRLALAAAPRAFNVGLAHGRGDFTHVAKLDGDVELPPDYYEVLLSRFAGDERLGIACGDLIEPDGPEWVRLAIPPHHVHGALKLYSRECLEAIGGVQERLGWDTIDETYARMRGFRTRSYPDLVARHHRPVATAERRPARPGPPRPLRLDRPLRLRLDRCCAGSRSGCGCARAGISGLAFVYGYLEAAARAGAAGRGPGVPALRATASCAAGCGPRWRARSRPSDVRNRRNRRRRPARLRRWSWRRCGR